DRVEALEQRERVRRVGLGIGADVACWQLPDVRLGVDLLALVGNQSERRNAFVQQRLVLTWQAAPVAKGVEAVVEPVLIGDAGYFREHRDDGGCADKGLEREAPWHAGPHRSGQTETGSRKRRSRRGASRDRRRRSAARVQSDLG